MCTCRHSTMVRRTVNTWWNVLPEICTDVSELVNASSLTNKPALSDMVKDAITEAYCWIMWKGRNDAAFNGRVLNPLIMANNIQSIVFSWIRSRCRNGAALNW